MFKYIGKPGEFVSCVGCHEKQSDIPPVKKSIASRKKASSIKPWYGPPRPFSFKYEIQPVLNKYCVSCHNGEKKDIVKDIPDFTDDKDKKDKGNESRSYIAFHPYVRRPGPESDMHMFKPMEYHASTSELIQMLKKGHHNVKLDKESWEKLYTWIDFNVPFRGNWAPEEFNGFDQQERRIELTKKYACIYDADPEKEYDNIAVLHEKKEPVVPVKPHAEPVKNSNGREKQEVLSTLEAALK